MKKTYAKKTFTKDYTVKGVKTHMVVTAELHSLGQAPYFSLTADIQDKYGWSGGCQHDEIAKHFPKLRPYIKWHLVSTDQPMHYIANSLYWAGLSGWCDGKPNSPPNYDYLVDTCKWGTLPGDESIDLHDYMRTDNAVENELRKFLLKELLENRLQSVQTEFMKAMTELFGEL